MRRGTLTRARVYGPPGIVAGVNQRWFSVGLQYSLMSFPVALSRSKRRPFHHKYYNTTSLSVSLRCL